MVNTIDPAATRSRRHQVRLLWRHEHGRVHGARGVAAEPVTASPRGLGGARWRSEQGVRGCEPPFPPVGGLQLRPWPRSLGGTRRAVGAVLCGKACFPCPGSGLATYPTTSPRAAPLPGPRSRRVRGGTTFRPALLPAYLLSSVAAAPFTSRDWLLYKVICYSG